MRAVAPVGLAALAGAVGLAVMWHVSVGARSVPLAEVWRAFVAPDPTLFDHAVVRDLRLPRAFSAAAVGAALALGDETALGLGLPVARIRGLAVVAVVALTAASVSAAGLLGFVGLVIPPVVRLPLITVPGPRRRCPASATV